VVVLLRLAVVAVDPDFLCEIIVVGHDGPGLPVGPQVLARVEAEAARDAHGACLPPLVEGPVGLAGILDDAQVVLPGDLQDGVHVGGLPEEVHGDDGLRPGRDGALELSGVHVAGVGLDVHENRLGPGKADGLGRGHERAGRGDHLVALTDAQGQKGKPEGVGAVADGHAMLRPAVGGELPLEFLDEGAAGEGRGIEDGVDGRPDFFPDRCQLGFQI